MNLAFLESYSALASSMAMRGVRAVLVRKSSSAAVCVAPAAAGSVDALVTAVASVVTGGVVVVVPPVFCVASKMIITTATTALILMRPTANGSGPFFTCPTGRGAVRGSMGLLGPRILAFLLFLLRLLIR